MTTTTTKKRTTKKATGKAGNKRASKATPKAKAKAKAKQPATKQPKPGKQNIAGPTPASKGVKYGVPRVQGLPSSPKQLAVLAALLKVGAVSATTAQSSTVIANAGQGLSPMHVRHHTYHGSCAVQPNGASGAITGVVTDFAGGNGYGYYITATGKKLLAQSKK